MLRILKDAHIARVDDRTIAQRNVGRLVRSVVRLWDEERDLDWVNRIAYLARPEQEE